MVAGGRRRPARDRWLTTRQSRRGHWRKERAGRKNTKAGAKPSVGYGPRLRWAGPDLPPVTSRLFLQTRSLARSLPFRGDEGRGGRCEGAVRKQKHSAVRGARGARPERARPKGGGRDGARGGGISFLVFYDTNIPADGVRAGAAALRGRRPAALCAACSPSGV